MSLSEEKIKNILKHLGEIPHLHIMPWSMDIRHPPPSAPAPQIFKKLKIFEKFQKIPYPVFKTMDITHRLLCLECMVFHMSLSKEKNI